MEWNVYYHDVNRRQITTFNIFQHYSFKEDVQEHLRKYRKYTDKSEFAEALKNSLLYFFWSKAEYEVLVSPWVGGDINDGIKVDIYSQVMLNWDKFVDYVWSQREAALKNGE